MRDKNFSNKTQHVLVPLLFAAWSTFQQRRLITRTTPDRSQGTLIPVSIRVVKSIVRDLPRTDKRVEKNLACANNRNARSSFGKSCFLVTSSEERDKKIANSGAIEMIDRSGNGGSMIVS